LSLSPGTLRIAEVDFDIRAHREGLVFGRLVPPIPGQRAPQDRGEFNHMLTQRGDDGRCVLAGHFDEHGKTRMSFHQGCDMTVLAASKQVALPMTGNSAVGA